MARTIKTRGMDELKTLERRVRRQWTLGRITEYDFAYLMTRIKEMEAHIVNMREYNEQGEEEG